MILYKKIYMTFLKQLFQDQNLLCVVVYTRKGLKEIFQKIKDKYNEILKNENVITHLYVPDVSGENGIRIDLGSNLKTDLPDASIPDDSVGAVLTMKLTTSDISFVNYMQNVVGIPKEYTVSCFMYREKTST